MEKDPNEWINVYNDPAYQTIANTLKAGLKDLMKQYKEPLLESSKLREE